MLNFQHKDTELKGLEQFARWFDNQFPKALKTDNIATRRKIQEATFSGKREMGNSQRPSADKTAAYKQSFRGNTKRNKEYLESLLYVRGANEKTGLIGESSRNAYMNKLISSASYKANSKSTLRVSSNATATKAPELLTAKTKRLKGRIAMGSTSKKYLVLNPSKHAKDNAYLQNKYGQIDELMLFKRVKGEDKKTDSLVPVGIFFKEAKYGKKGLYKLPNIQRHGKQHYDRMMRLIEKQIQRFGGKSETRNY